MLGVNLVSISSFFFMCLYNLNDRFTPLFVKNVLIPHSLMFCNYSWKDQAKNDLKSSKVEPAK